MLTTTDESLYDPDLPEAHVNGAGLIVASGVGIIIGLIIDYAIWMAWLATRKSRSRTE